MRLRYGALLGSISMFLFLSGVEEARGCEPCAVFGSTRLRETEPESWSFSISEQFTEYEESETGPSPNALRNGEVLRSYSVTRADVAYAFDSEFSLALSVPLVVREFDQIKNFRRREEHESGIGDMTLYLLVAPYSVRTVESAVHAVFFGGVKMPTGDTGTLGDHTKLEEDGEAAPHEVAMKHHPAIGGNGVGPVLSLGSGSWDVLVGAGILTRLGRWVVFGTTEYMIRSEGDFDYRFGNALLWSAGPALYLVTTDDVSVALKGELSGEHKPGDKLEGNTVEGSSVSSVYAGPGLFLSGFERLGVDLALQLPVYTDNEDAIVVPDYRIRASMEVKF